MIKIFPPRKGGKGSAPTESKRAGSSKASDLNSQTTTDSGSAKSESTSPEPAASDPNSFFVKAPQKTAPKPLKTQSKETVASASVPPPKQKASPKVQVAAAIPKDDAAGAGNNQKSRVSPPKKKNDGHVKPNVATAVPELSAEDAYDYEL